MDKKFGILLTVIIVVIGAFVGKLLSNQQESMKKRPSIPVVSNYKFQTISNRTENFDIELSGTLKSYNSVDLFAEVTGIAKSGKIEFREGAIFKKGDVLLKINDTEYRNNVYAQKSAFMNTLTLLIPDLKYDFPESATKWENYLNSFEISKSLKPLPKITNEKEKYYITSKNILNQYYSIKSQEARLAKYTIRAPFDGVISSSSINPGTLVRAAQPIGSFKNTSLFEMTAFAGIDVVQMLSVGMPVKLNCNDVSGIFDGKISRINQSVDKASQTVKVYISVKSDELLDGMYFNAVVNVSTIKPVAKVSHEAIFNAGSVWINEMGKFKSHEINVVNRDDKFVFAEGLKEGQKLLINPDKNVVENKTIPTNNPQEKNQKNDK